MAAFADPAIKAIISTIGGDECCQLLRYVDLDIIRQNPQLFLGFSAAHVVLFDPVGEVRPNPAGWTSELLDWSDNTWQNTLRTLVPSTGWNFLQGTTRVPGRLLGGCLEALESLKGTPFWPTAAQWAGAIVFFETSEVRLELDYFRWWLRNYAQQGILQAAQGILVGRPDNKAYVQEYNAELRNVLAEEGLQDLSVLTEMDFGRTSPTFTPS